MAPSSKIDPSRRPDVAIVYSESSSHSGESYNLAHYLCGLLAEAGFSNLFMIGIDAHTGGPALQLAPSKRILFPRVAGGRAAAGDPYSRKNLVEIPAADVTPAYLDKIQTCNVVIVTVNSDDMTPLKRQLVDMLDPKRQGAPRSTTIFSIQRGVRNAMVIKDAFTGRKDIAVVEGVVGFAVVVHPKTGAFCPTLSRPAVVFERLSKEIEDIADGPLRLLEHTSMETMFDKTLTPYSWGVMVWENLYALNVVAGGSIRDTLLLSSSARGGHGHGAAAATPAAAAAATVAATRLLLAAMTRECRVALTAAARGGQWRPQFRLQSTWLSPWLWEMLLVLPGGGSLGLLRLACWFLDVLPSEGVISPGQLDLAEGRRTMVDCHLGELLATGRRNSVAMPVCAAVAARIAKMETGVRECKPGAGQGSAADVLDLLREAEEALGATVATLASKSKAECKFWLVRLVALLSLLPVLWFLLVHDY